MKIFSLLILTGCATAPITKPNVIIPSYSAEIDTLRYYAFSQQYVNDVNLCQTKGEICKLKKAGDCDKKQETCVVDTYKAWLYVKKEHGWK